MDTERCNGSLASYRFRQIFAFVFRQLVSKSQTELGLTSKRFLRNVLRQLLGGCVELFVLQSCGCERCS